MELIELTVTEEFEMARLDQFLAGHLTQSRTYIQKFYPQAIRFCSGYSG